MGGFLRAFCWVLFKRLWIAASFLLIVFGIYEFTKSRDWPWFTIFLVSVILAQGFVCFEFWRQAQEHRPRFLLSNARRFIDAIRDEGAELKATIHQDPPRTKPQPGPKERVQDWIERASLTLEVIRGEPARNTFVRACNSFGKTGDWNRRTCREILEAGVGYLSLVHNELDESKIRTDWNGEQPTPRT